VQGGYERRGLFQLGQMAGAGNRDEAAAWHFLLKRFGRCERRVTVVRAPQDQRRFDPFAPQTLQYMHRSRGVAGRGGR